MVRKIQSWRYELRQRRAWMTNYCSVKLRIEDASWSRSKQNCSWACRRTRSKQISSFRSVPQIRNSMKLDKWEPHELNENQRNGKLRRGTKNRFCTTIAGVLLRGWTTTKLLNTFLSRNSIKGMLWCSFQEFQKPPARQRPTTIRTTNTAEAAVGLRNRTSQQPTTTSSNISTTSCRGRTTKCLRRNGRL